MFRRRRNPDVYVISTARPAHSDEQAVRRRKYAIAMSVRIFCFGFVPFTHGAVQAACVVGALVLPWVAVVLANAGMESGRTTARTGPIETGRELH